MSLIRGTRISLLTKKKKAAFSPLSLSAALWLDASDASTLYQDSGLATPAVNDADPVGGWKDKSGNARHLTQGTLSQRPTLRTGVLGGKPVVRFDGVDDFLASAAFALNQPSTVMLVCRPTTATNVTFLDSRNALTRAVIRGIGTELQASCHAGSQVNGDGLTSNAWYILTAFFNGASSGVRRNADTLRTGDAGNDTPSGFVLGCRGLGASQFNNFDFAEVVAVPSALAASDETLLRNYLNAKWNVF